MKLQTNSWHYKLYKFYYQKLPPNNLCPYFWKLLFAIITVIPFSIIALPALIIYSKDKESIGIRMRDSIILYLILCVFITMCFTIAWLFIRWNTSENSLRNNLVVVGFVFWTVTIIFGMIYLIKEIIIPYFENIFYSSTKSRKKKSKNIVVEFIKAKYNNYCPMIVWEDTDDIEGNIFKEKENKYEQY